MATSVETPLGHSVPPEGPHTVTFHVPTWANALRFRDGDASLFMQLKSVYPRFSPFGPSALMVKAVGEKLQIPEGRGLVPHLSPDVWRTNERHATSQQFRKDQAVAAGDLKYHVVEVAGIRLYLVEFPATKRMAASFMWQHGGLGFNTRLGEHLLAQIDTLRSLGEFAVDAADIPPPTYLPEVESHGLLRRRIAELLMRATVREYEKSVQEDDVYLYQTGMAGILRFHEVAMKERPGPVVVFGAVFHSTWHLFEENPQGFKHYGKCDENDLDEFEKYLDQGGKCSYVFTEFPSNPILVSVDLIRLRKLADKHGFWIVIDDTVSSFCNIDVLPVADAVITSLSKSFSGFADLLAGSTALNPNQAASYAILKPLYTVSHFNEVFAGDADKLLQNSEDYLARSVTLNRNAAAMTAYFQSQVEDPKVPVRKVCYPPYVSVGSTPPLANLQPFRRRPTPDFPEPGHGCLFSVELETERDTIAFYNNLAFHQGPHLGAHRSLVIPYNAMIYGGGDDAAYHDSYGLSPNQIRFSVGLEDEKELIDVCQRAVAAMLEAGSQK